MINYELLTISCRITEGKINIVYEIMYRHLWQFKLLSMDNCITSISIYISLTETI